MTREKVERKAREHAERRYGAGVSVTVDVASDRLTRIAIRIPGNLSDMPVYQAMSAPQALEKLKADFEVAS